MLFDCGEDSQRQLLKQPQIVHGKINRIFVTDLGSTNIYGIPGKQHFLLCWNNTVVCYWKLLVEFLKRSKTTNNSCYIEHHVLFAHLHCVHCMA